MSLNTSLNYSYLRIPDEVAQNVKHKQNDIFYLDSTNNKIYRNIYNKQSLEQNEQSILQQLIEDLKKSNIIYSGIINNDADLLRFHKYSQDIHETTANIVYYIQYMMDPNKTKLTQHGKNVLDSGIIYLGGRDKKLRPTLMINAHKIDISNSDNIQGFQNALIYLVKKVENNLLSPGYIENMNVIIETNAIEKSIQIGSIREMINLVTKLFPARVNLIFVMNLSELMLKKNWKMIESCLQTEQKNSIKLISSANLRDLRSHYHAAELEIKYGGTAANVESFWPPVNLVNQSFYRQTNNTSMASQAPLNQSDLINQSLGSIIMKDHQNKVQFLEPVKETQAPVQQYSGLEEYEFQYLNKSRDSLLKQYAPQNQSFTKQKEHLNESQSHHQIQQADEMEQNTQPRKSSIQEDLEKRQEIEGKKQSEDKKGFLCGICYRSKQKQEEEEKAKEKTKEQLDQQPQDPEAKSKQEQNQKNSGPCLIF